MVFVLPYKCPELVKIIQDKIAEINLKGRFLNLGMGIQDGGIRALSSYSMSPEERKNKNLDFIGSFQIMDNEFRIIILEGISHKGMKELEEATRIL